MKQFCYRCKRRKMLPEGKCRRSRSYLASVVTSTSRVFPFLKARSISLGKRAHSKFPHFSKESLLSHDLCSSVVDFIPAYECPNLHLSIRDRLIRSGVNMCLLTEVKRSGECFNALQRIKWKCACLTAALIRHSNNPPYRA